MQTQFNVWRVQDELHKDSIARQLDIRLQAIRNEWEHSHQNTSPEAHGESPPEVPKEVETPSLRWASGPITLWNCFGCRTRRSDGFGFDK